MNPARVALISFHTCPLASTEGKESGGMNVYVLELAKALAKQGLIVDIYTRSQAPDNPEIVEVAENLRLIHLIAGPQGPYPKHDLIQLIDEFVEAYQTFTKAHQLSYDLLHCHYYLSGLIGQKIQERKDSSHLQSSSSSQSYPPSLPASFATPHTSTHLSHLPLVFTFHTLGLMKNLVARNAEEREPAARISAERTIVQRADRIISLSENERDYLEYLYNVPAEKITVIPPGVDLSLFRPIAKDVACQHIGADPAHKIILFAGRIEAVKGIDVLLYATKILLAKNPDINQACVWIVGGDVSEPKTLWSSELQRLEALQHDLGLSSVVHFAGQQTQEELPYYYNAAQLVVMPSHYESFGMVAAEAMACGTPVITTNVSGFSRLIDDTHQHLITSANNPLLLATQMEHILKGTVEYEEARRADSLRKTVEDLDWAVIGKQVQAVYEDVMS